MTDLDHLQHTIGIWHVDTFPDVSIQTIALKLIEEAVELAIASGVEASDVIDRCSLEAGRTHTGGIEEELCDVLIVGMALAARLPVDGLEASIMSKHNTNINRFGGSS